MFSRTFLCCIFVCSFISFHPFKAYSEATNPGTPSASESAPVQPAGGSQLEKFFSVGAQQLSPEIAPSSVNRALEQYGYNFFKNDLSQVANSANQPVGMDYVIGPGDVVNIDVWGHIQFQHSLEVSRTGEIVIPKIGAVRLWGLTYAQAIKAIEGAFSKYFTDYQLNVNLGKLRTIQVFVVGEVNAPGAYSISSLSTVINALSVAGGPAKNGSLRNITVRRGGELIEGFDLYDFLMKGDKKADIRLNSGDTVFVPLIGEVAGVAGAVKRPAIYELKKDTSLSDLVEMAGGLTANADPQNVKTERIVTHRERIALDNGISDLSDMEAKWDYFKIKDRDLVKIYPLFNAQRKMVKLQGHVVHPGEYQLKKQMRVSDIIKSFDDLLPEPYTRSASIIRLIPPDYHPEIITFDLEKAIARDPASDIVLQEQDTIAVFSSREKEEEKKVQILGAVIKPGTYRLHKNMRVKDLVDIAGLKKNSFLITAELSRLETDRMGKAHTSHVEVNLSKAIEGDPEFNIPLNDEDALLVRPIPEWSNARERYVTLSGEFKFPGTYSIYKGEKISSVIERAGGFTSRANIRAAKFTREKVKEIQQKRIDEYKISLEKKISQREADVKLSTASPEELASAKDSIEAIKAMLKKLENAQAEGRVVIHLQPNEQFKGSTSDVELLGSDHLDVPADEKVVNVIGEVYNPTALLHNPGMDIDYYFKKVGGATKDADKDEIYVVKADGTVISRQQKKGLWPKWDDNTKSWFSGGFMSSKIESGDTIVVPREFEKVVWMKEIKDVVSIISQIALTAGIVIAAGL